jgi:hypothetical protein
MMRTFPLRAFLLVVLLLGFGCEKAGTNIKGSGSLSDSEKALLKHIPSGANLLFGGDYERFMEYWENSPLRKFSESMAAAAMGNNSMQSYMNCWIEKEKGTKLAGSLALKGGSMEMTMVFTGMKPEVLTTCADEAKMAYKKDDDGKYIELQGISDGLGGSSNIGYYFVDESTAFFAFEMPIALLEAGNVPTPDRKALEERVAAAAKSPAIDDDAMKALLEKANRSKAFWFSGTAAGTPAAEHVKEGHGWVDVDKSSLTLAFSIELTDASMAAKAVEEFKGLDSKLGMMPPMIKEPAEEFLKDAKLENSGGTLRGRFVLKNSLLDKVLPLAQGMGGMGF